MIPYGRQDISEEDINAVVAVLNSDWLTQGPAVLQFETSVATLCGARHAVAVNSATSALHLACLALDLGPGDWLWTSPITFVASANCGRLCGAQVAFVDIDPATLNLSVKDLADKLAAARRADRLPKVVVPVHFAGQPCNMQEIGALADEYGFRIIEDASHAIGATYQGEPVGCGRYSDVTVFSFHPVKIITCGEGGMAVTNDEQLAARMSILRSHGITRDESIMRGANEGPWYYEQIDLGFNYRMTDLQAALGCSQLRRLRTFIDRRRELANRYDRLLAGLPLQPQKQESNGMSAWHLYIIQLDEALAGEGRRRVFDELRDAGVGVQVHYIPVHLQPYYRRQAVGAPADLPVAEAYYRRAITLPLFTSLEDAQQDAIVAALESAMR